MSKDKPEVADLFGSNVILIGSLGNKSYYKEDVISEIRKYNLESTLLRISKLSSLLTLNGLQLLHGSNFKDCSNYYRRTPITQSQLVFISTYLINYSNAHRRKCVTISELFKLSDIWLGLEEDLSKYEKECSISIIYAYYNYIHQRQFANDLARLLLIYNDLWHKNPISNDVDIHAALNDEVGLSLDDIIIMCYVFVGQVMTKIERGEEGYITTYSSADLDNLSTDKIANYLTLEKQTKFFKYL
ncbi:MAG: hypothetical protein ABIG42_00400, partial [bacterium]